MNIFTDSREARYLKHRFSFDLPDAGSSTDVRLACEKIWEVAGEVYRLRAAIGQACRAITDDMKYLEADAKAEPFYANGRRRRMHEPNEDVYRLPALVRELNRREDDLARLLDAFRALLALVLPVA